MRLVTFLAPPDDRAGSQPAAPMGAPGTGPQDTGAGRLGAIVGDLVVDLATATDGDPAFTSLVALAAAGAPARRIASDVVARAGAGDLPDRTLCPLDTVTLLAPVPRPPKNVMCVGLNYRSHVEQNAKALGEEVVLPTVPLFFSKPPTAIVGPGAPVVRDRRLTKELDYEVELAAVVGRRATWLEPDEVLDAILGFTLVNDVTARDLQWRTSQFFYGKGLDTFCPMGPAVVTLDELPPWPEIVLELWVDGELRQQEPAGGMLFSPLVALSELSKGITLEPGDVVSLGTPGGCGYQMDPPRYLEPGDVMTCRATGIGSLENPVVAHGN